MDLILIWTLDQHLCLFASKIDEEAVSDVARIKERWDFDDVLTAEELDSMSMWWNLHDVQIARSAKRDGCARAGSRYHRLAIGDCYRLEGSESA